MMLNFYDLLGITSLATPHDIDIAYGEMIEEAQLAVTADPTNELARVKLEQVELAYETLSDSETRQHYDSDLNNDKQTSITYQKPLNEPSFNFAQYRLDQLEHYTELLGVTEYDHPVTVLSKLFNVTLDLPDSEIQLPFLISSILAPSALCHTLPSIICYGEPGSGKSVACKIASEVWGINALSSTSTFAAIRNMIDVHRWSRDGGIMQEKNMLLVWNDIAPRDLTEQMKSLLKAYNRREANIEIANTSKDSQGNKNNLTFNVFCLKVLSTVHPIFADPQFAEIARRSLIIYCRKTTNNEIIQLDDIGFNGFRRIIRSFWETPENCREFSKINFRDVKGSIKASVDRFNTIEYVLRTGMVLGIWKSRTEAVQAFERFEEYQAGLKVTHGDELKRMLQSWAVATMNTKRTLGQKPLIMPSELKQYLSSCVNAYKLDKIPPKSRIDALLVSLGYSYNSNQHYWS